MEPLGEPRVILIDNIDQIPFNYIHYINSVKNKWESIILSSPNNIKICISLYFVEDLGDNILGCTNVEKLYHIKSNRIFNYCDIKKISGTVIPIKGTIKISKRYFYDEKIGLSSIIYDDGNDGIYYTLLHEFGHMLGILLNV